MFKITVNGTELWIKFIHDHENKKTFCSILNPQTNTTQSASVKFNPKDNAKMYSKWSGKMLALTKVLKVFDFSKDERREIWLGFLANFPIKRNRR